MKTKYLLLLAAFSFALPVRAQRPVSTAFQNCKVVLEQFTGTHCATCPNGHRIADSLKAVKPAGKVFIVNIHTGGVAAPYAGEPDLRTSDGAGIAAITGMNITSYPTASINRQRFGTSTNLPLSPAQWSAAIDTVTSQVATHNLAIDGYLNVSTRTLTVASEIYSQSSIAPWNSNRYYTVMLLEDSVYGPQLGEGQYSSQIDAVSGLYKHNHTLRKILTLPHVPLPAGIANSYGTGFYYPTLTYTVPAQYINNPAILGNLKLLVYLSYYDSTIINAATGPITLTGFAHTKDAEVMSVSEIEKEVCTAPLKPIVRIYNNGSTPITSATLQSSLNGGPFLPAGAFSGSLAPATSTFVAVPQIAFAPYASNSLNLKIVNVNGSPDANPANDTLTVSNILRTTRLAKGWYVAMRFTQDRFGAESTWQIIEEATGTVKLSGGPYPNLGNSGIAIRTDSFRADPEQCYEVVVKDALANGINNGSGAGGYQVVSNGVVLYTSNGQYGARDRVTFKTAESLIEPSGIKEIAAFERSVMLLPNPTADESNLVFTLTRGTRASVQVLDMTGRVVGEIAEQNLAPGTHRLPIVTAALAGGVYNIKLATAEGVVTRRLAVVK